MSPSKISPVLGYQFFRPVQWPLSTILFHNHFYLSGCSSDKFFTKCLLFYRGALMPLLQKEVLYSWYVLSQHSSPGKPQRQYSLHLSLLLFQPQCLQIFKVYNCRAFLVYSYNGRFSSPQKSPSGFHQPSLLKVTSASWWLRTFLSTSSF